MIKSLTILTGILLLTVELCSTFQNVTFSTIKNRSLYLKEYAKSLLDEKSYTFLLPCLENDCCVKDDQIWCDYYLNLVLTLNRTEGVVYDRERLNTALSNKILPKNKVYAFCNDLSQKLPTFAVKWKEEKAINISQDIAQSEFCWKFCVDMPMVKGGTVMATMCLALDQLANMIPKISTLAPKPGHPILVVSEPLPSAVPIMELPKAVESDKQSEQSLQIPNNVHNIPKDKLHVPKSAEKPNERDSEHQGSKIAKNIKTPALSTTQEQASKNLQTANGKDKPTENLAPEAQNDKPKKVENTMKSNEKADSPKVIVPPPAQNEPNSGENLPKKENPAPAADTEIESPVKKQPPQPNPQVDKKETNNQESILNSETNPDDGDDLFGQDQQRSDQGMYSNEEENAPDDFRPPKLDAKEVEKEQTLLQTKKVKEETKLKTSDINVNYIPASDPFYEEEGSNFFTYFLMGMFGSILLYVLYHNKTKILALILEGRRSQKGRSRRKHTAHYTKLDTNLEEAITSSASGRSTQIIY